MRREVRGTVAAAILAALVVVGLACAPPTPARPALSSPTSSSWFWYGAAPAIDFEWNSSGKTDEFELEVDSTPGFNNPILTVPVQGTNYTWTSPPRGGYHWRVYPKGRPDCASEAWSFDVGPYVAATCGTSGDIPYASAQFMYNGDEYLLLACESGLRVLNVGIAGTNPEVVAHVNVAGTGCDIDVKEHYAFVAAGAAGLKVFDIEDPRSPREVGAVAVPGQGASCVVVYPYVGDWHVYVGSDSGLCVVDCAVLSQPRVVATVSSSKIGFPLDLSVLGDYLLAATNLWGVGRQGLYCIDISDPDHPQVGTYHATDGSAVAVYADYGMIWLASLPRKLEILNSLPMFEGLGEFELADPPACGSISLSFPGTHVFVGTDKGLEIIDVSPPGDCHRLASIEFPYVTTSAAASSGLTMAFVTNTIDGLYVVRTPTMNLE